MFTNIPIVRNDGSQDGTFEIAPECLELGKGAQAVQDSIVAYLAAQRAGTASTKTRAEVRGGGAKPYRQKGTGRARMGSHTSPLLGGGGVTFGPRPRDYSKKVNAKAQRLALKRSFSERLQDGDVILVDEIALTEPKTRQMLAFLKNIEAGEDVLLVVDEANTALLLASRNLPNVEVMKAGSVNPYWMLLFKKVVFDRPGLDKFMNRFRPQETE